MIKSLTSLRGIFILFIFFHHCLNLYAGGGTMGVAFFFILSGFSMTLGYKDRIMLPDFNFKQYMIRRLIKFYPLHWLCLLLALALSLLTLKFGLKDVPIFVLNAGLLQTWIPIRDIYFSFNAVSWFLADTMFFALLFPMLLKMILKANPMRKGAILVILMLLYTILVIFLPKERYHDILYISPFVRTADFIFGIILALCYTSLKEDTRITLLLGKYSSLFLYAVVFIIVLLVIESCLLGKTVRMIAPVYWPLIGVLILTTSLSETESTGGGYYCINNVFTQMLGELSFSIFLIHQLVLRITTNLFMFLNIPQNIIYVVFTLALTIFISAEVNKYILNPISQWLTKRIQLSMTAR